MRILAVGAHPDDLEILCGGTLAKYARSGHSVVMAHATRGDKGTFHVAPDEIARTRDAEARAAGAVIGAEVIALNAGDGELYSEDREIRDIFVDLIRSARPDLIITHAPDDYMADHNAVSKLVFDASFMATLPHYPTRAPYHGAVTPIYYMDTLAGVNFLPAEYVDISADIDQKRGMLRSHASQLVWLKEHDGIDIVEFMETMSRFRGLQCGVGFAEGFVPARVWLRQRAERLLP
jgi:LmbE family N-acetylglucosaminyl deacetylase